MFTEPLASIDVLPELPAGHPLTSAWAKFARAREHFQALSTAGHEIVQATLANGALQAQRVAPGLVSVRARLPVIPIRTACILGDITHGLRTALDHVAWALAQRAQFAGSRTQVQFPIAADAAAFTKKRSAYVAMFGAAAVDVVEQVQPYYDRPGLSWLSDLNNADKHEAVVLARHHLELTGVEIEDRVGRRPLHDSGGPNAPLIKADGEEMFQCRYEGEHLQGVEFHVGMVASLGLCAAPARSWPAERLDLIVRQMFADVEDTLLTMRGLFDAGRS